MKIHSKPLKTPMNSNQNMKNLKIRIYLIKVKLYSKTKYQESRLNTKNKFKIENKKSQILTSRNLNSMNKKLILRIKKFNNQVNIINIFPL